MHVIRPVPVHIDGDSLLQVGHSVLASGRCMLVWAKAVSQDHLHVIRSVHVPAHNHPILTVRPSTSGDVLVAESPRLARNLMEVRAIHGTI